MASPNSIAPAEKTTTTRRSHRKSREGCLPCKKRRIKCDECRPECRNCVRRRMSCAYGSTYPPGPALDIPTSHADTISSNASTMREDNLPSNPATGLAGTGPEQDERIQQSSGTPGRDAFTSRNKTTTLSTTTGPARAGLEPAYDDHGPAHPIDQAGAGDPSSHRYNHHVQPPRPVLSQSTAFISFPNTSADFALLHHYTLTAHRGLCVNASQVPFWQSIVPKLAFAQSKPFLLQLMLALSALHLRRQDQGQFWLAQAESLYGAALPVVVALLPVIDVTNCEALYMAGVLIAFYHFAAGPVNGEYLLFRTDSDAGADEDNETADFTWFTLLRGVREIVGEWGHVLADGVLRKENDSAQRDGEKTTKSLLSFKKQFNALRGFLELMSAEGMGFEKYAQALESLEECFDAKYQDDEVHSVEDRECADSSHVVFAWLYRLSDDYVESLRLKRPVALIIFAHYAVIMKDLDGQWLFDGWVEHIMTGIEQALNPHFVKWLQWPKAQVGFQRD